METSEKVVALGINCAWDNADIPVVLEVLEQAEVKATFFILGQWCEKYPESVQQIAQAGHEIASHSNSHTSLDTLSQEEIAAEVTASAQKLEQATGQELRLVRPPSGAYNNLVISTIKELHYMPIQWDVDSLDWKGISASEITARMMERVQNGSITLLHSGAPHMAEALPQLIDELQKQGFQLRTVGEMICWDTYTIDHMGRQIAIQP